MTEATMQSAAPKKSRLKLFVILGSLLAQSLNRSVNLVQLILLLNRSLTAVAVVNRMTVAGLLQPSINLKLLKRLEKQNEIPE